MCKFYYLIIEENFFYRAGGFWVLRLVFLWEIDDKNGIINLKYAKSLKVKLIDG